MNFVRVFGIETIDVKQLLADTRKFKLDLIDRSDIAALSRLASEVTGIPMMHEIETELFEEILTSRGCGFWLSLHPPPIR